MKKFLALFIAVLSVFCFSSCEDTKEILEYKLLGRGIGATNIIIHEVNDNGDILKKRSIYELKGDEYSQVFIADENASEIHAYYKSGNFEINSYYRGYTPLFSDEINELYLSTMIEITEEEYNFYVNQ